MAAERPPPTPTTRARLGPLRPALIAGLPTFVLLVLAPANIYLGNQPSFDHRYQVVLHLAAAHVGIVALLYCLFLLAPGIRRPVAYGLATIGVLFAAAFALTSVPMGKLLTGGTLVADPSPRIALLDAGALVALAFVYRVVSTEVLVDVAALFVALASLVAPAVVLYEVHASDADYVGWEERELPPPATVADEPNVYHLVFDAFQSDLFEPIVEGFGLASRFDGFVLYENARAEYPITALSFPSFMTGRVFDEAAGIDGPGRIARREGLVKALAGRGYAVSQYNAWYVNDHRLAHRRRSVAQIETRTYGDLRRLVELLDVSVLVSMPGSVKPLLVHGGTGPFARLLRRSGLEMADWSRNRPLLSRMLAEQMQAEEAERPPRGQYVLAHLMMPHAPFALSQACEYQPDRGASKEDLVEQATCAVRVLAGFLDELRRLGRYRDALIVVHGDHGAYRKFRPLLLVKYPGREHEALRSDARAVHLLDVAPTILDAVGLPVAGMRGRPLREAAHAS